MANGFNYKFKEEVEAGSLDWNPSDKRAIVWNAVCNKQISLGDYIAIFKKKGETKTAYIYEMTDENCAKGFQFCVLKNGKTKEIHTCPADNNSRFGRIGEKGQMC